MTKNTIRATSWYLEIDMRYNSISSETIDPIKEQKTVSDRFLASPLCRIIFRTVRFDFDLSPPRFR